MNFNYLLLILLFLNSSCGVKSDPVHPKGTSLPSIIDEYKEKKEKKK